MRGIISWGAYVPYRRLDRGAIAPVAGMGGGSGTRSAASYDEDATTMAVAAARQALHSAPGTEPGSLWFATTTPPYADKTNATAVHAALRLRRTAPAFDMGSAVRSAFGALRAASNEATAALVVCADLRGGLPGSADEAAGGDAGAALLLGDGNEDEIAAELVAWGSTSEEFVDRWRAPGDGYSKTWEQRFGESRYTELGVEALTAALNSAEIGRDDIGQWIVTSTHERAAKAVAKKIGAPPERTADDLSATVGNTGAAAPALLLAATLEKARPGQLVALVALADGADVIILRTTRALVGHRNTRPVAEQIAAGGPVSYAKFLSWRGLLPVQPPNRPEPARPSSSAAARNTDWKYGFVGTRAEDGTIHLPPGPSDPQVQPMADATGTVVTYTIDRLAYSLSPPVVFAVVDFDGGGRLPVELTDVDAEEVHIGMQVEMTFRRLFSADGIHNYFWKARPIR
jgi:3-hydroxy-3-methylglutaryl CoA synthase/uncharacterized OB-fold protein